MLRSMPRGKNITPAQRQAWLEQYEQGATVITLAKRENRDVRTIKAQLQRAVDEREMVIARRDLIRESLSAHNEELRQAATRVLESVGVVPDERITPVSSFPKAHGVERGRLAFDPSVSSSIAVVTDPNSRDGKFEKLLREHLKSERTLWRGIDRWQDRHASYQSECLELGRQVSESVVKATCLEPVESSRNAEGFTEHFVSWSARLAIESWRNDRTKPKIDLSIGGGSLMLGGSTLARSESDEKLELARQEFIDQVDAMRRSREVRLIAEEQAWLEAQAEKLRDRLENLLLFGLIPGKCLACRRYAI